MHGKASNAYVPLTGKDILYVVSSSCIYISKLRLTRLSSKKLQEVPSASIKYCTERKFSAISLRRPKLSEIIVKI